jgi:twitching motility protein PilT
VSDIQPDFDITGAQPVDTDSIKAAPIPGLDPVAMSETAKAEMATAVATTGMKPRSLESIHIDDLLRIVVEKGASDLHFLVGAEPTIRVDGQLIRLNYEKATPNDTVRMIYDVLTDEQIQRFESTLELDLSYALGKLARFRVNVFRDKGAIAVAFRLIPARIPTIAELNLPPILVELTRLKRGLVLCTGPTGHGKSTSLAAMLHQINMERAVHILTIEDPIEYLHPHKLSIINQRELGQDTKAFQNALRAALREDPDVILVGEMRDTETIALAITAAETGHLVFATLHTNSAGESIDRMVDVFPPGQQEQVRIQIANTIQAIVCQQLLPRAGQPGRIPATEVMVATPAIRNLIRENKTHQIPSSIQTSAGHGMQTMDQALRDLYLRGAVSYDDALSFAVNIDELKKMLMTAGGIVPGARPGGAPPPGGQRR